VSTNIDQKPGPSPPELSVVVGLVSGDVEHVRTCLTALDAQRFQGMEILVPYDDPVADVTSLRSEFPDVEFIRAEGLDTAEARSGLSREHHGAIRTIGLRRARGRVVAMLEDVGRAEPGWCRGMLDAFERHPDAGAVGGGMSCGSGRLLNRAVCLCDYWRYQVPIPEAPSRFASDANIAYRREVLESVGGAREDSFHETVVNGELLARGHEIWLTPAATVYQMRGPLGWGRTLQERYVWGRSFGGRRVRGVPLSKRLVYAAFCPALPLLLASRAVRIAWSRGSFWSACLPVLPVVLLLFAVWSFGELVGYLSGRPD
jgi:hypothetical protein